MAMNLEPLPPLSQRQGDVLLIIADWFAKWRQSPSTAQVKEKLGLQPTTNLGGYVKPLVQLGYLKEPQRYSRQPYQLTPQAIEALPLLLAERQKESPELKAFIEQYLAVHQDQ